MQERVPAPPEFGTIADAVTQFGPSRRTLYRLAGEHPGLFVKVGARTLVHYGDLRAILAAAPVANIRPTVPRVGEARP